MARTSSTPVTRQGRSTIKNPSIDLNKDDGSVLLSVVRGEEIAYNFTFNWLTPNTAPKTTPDLATANNLVTNVSDNVDFYTDDPVTEITLEFSSTTYIAPTANRGYKFTAETAGDFSFPASAVTADSTNRTWTVSVSDLVEGSNYSTAVDSGTPESVTSLLRFDVTFHTTSSALILTFDDKNDYFAPNAVSTYNFQTATDFYEFPYSAIVANETARTWTVAFEDVTSGEAPAAVIAEANAEAITSFERKWNELQPLSTTPFVIVIEADNTDGTVPDNVKTGGISSKIDLEVVTISDTEDPRYGEPVSPFQYKFEIPGGDREASTAWVAHSSGTGSTENYSEGDIARYKKRFYKAKGTATDNSRSAPAIEETNTEWEYLTGNDYPELTSDWTDSSLAPNKPMYAFFGMEITDNDQTWKPIRGLIEVLYSTTYEE